jgi:hypothetical protein
MSRLGPRPLAALLALVLTGAAIAGAGLLVAWGLERGLQVRLGEHLPGGGEWWRVVTSCALAGVLASLLLARPIVARARRAAGASLAVALVVGVGGFTASAGEVTIVEFSPDRFEARTRTYHAIPFVWWRATPERTTYHLQEARAYLVEHGLLAPTSREEARWFFSRGYRYDVRGWHNTARSLERELHPRCVAWSRRHPYAAGLMWPEVVRAAQAGDLSRAASVLRCGGTTPGW